MLIFVSYQLIIRNMKTIVRHEFFEDGGHGWLKVSKSRLQSLNILDKISHYSYERNGFVYLEEDSDLSVYVNELLNIECIKRGTTEYIDFMSKFWSNVSKFYSHKTSKIRGYERFDNLTEEQLREFEDLRVLLLGFKSWNTKNKNKIKNAKRSDLTFWGKHYGLLK